MSRSGSRGSIVFIKGKFDNFYQVPQDKLWQTHKESLHNLRLGQKIHALPIKQYKEQVVSDNAVVFSGFASDEGVKRNHGRKGAHYGPKAIRECLAKIPLTDHLDSKQYYDVGDIVCHGHQLEQAQNHLATLVEVVLHHHAFPVVLGGGHETAWGHWLGLANTWPERDIAILNLDAHFDMRPLLVDKKGTSGTPFLQVAEFCENRKKPFNYYCLGIDKFSNTKQLFDTAQTWQVNYLTIDEILANPAEIEPFLSRVLSHDYVYVTLCMDVFSSSVAPGVSAVSSLGLMPHQVLPILRECAASGKCVAFDVVECAPPLDTDNRTAKLAAYCIAEFLDNL